VLLAAATTSSSVSNGTAVTTGPKISSVWTAICSVTEVISVGATK
jgi:hypothetical protein